MRVVACQWDITWEDKAANHARVRHLLAAARPRRDSLVVLPEMFATGFSMNVAGITDSGSGETHRFLAATAESHGVYLLGGLVTGEADGEGRNEAVLYSPRGQEAGRYRKIHPYTLAAENEHFVGGDDVALWACNEFVLAPFVCYDLRFPEVFRTAAARGATLFCVIASWPAARSDHWHTLLRARAIENQAYVVGVNRCGDDPAVHYSGGSVIFGPQGQVLAQAGAEDGTIAAELDLIALQHYRRAFPSLADMRWRAL
jgi:omega-amidase